MYQSPPRSTGLTGRSFRAASSRSAAPARDGLIFTNDRGLPIRRNGFTPIFRRAADQAGIAPGHGFHELRHHYASLLISSGCSVTVVQRRLGHASAQETLDTYSHLWPDDDQRTTKRLILSLDRRSPVESWCNGGSRERLEKAKPPGKRGFGVVSPPVSRILSRTTIHLGTPLPMRSCGLPGT